MHKHRNSWKQLKSGSQEKTGLNDKSARRGGEGGKSVLRAVAVWVSMPMTPHSSVKSGWIELHVGVPSGMLVNPNAVSVCRKAGLSL